MDGPLKHLTVLDLTIARAGPTAVRLLADWGARVIKIEPPVAGDAADRNKSSATGGRHGPDEQNLHRNKYSLALDLKSTQGLDVFYDLARQADVIVENFRSEVKFRLGIDYETIKRHNPAIVYASISGFGQAGPDASRPGVDQIVQGESGLMSITGEPGQGPMRVGVAISDTSAGMFLGQGILLALLHRERTGEGQWVHTSLLEAMLNKLDFQGARYTMAGDVAAQQGNDHPTQVPMGAYMAADGHINIAAFGEVMWQRFCDALQAQDLLTHPDYQSARARAANKAQLKVDMNAVTQRFTIAALITRLNEAGVPCGAIHDIGQAFDSEQVKFLQMAKAAPHAQLGDIKLLRSPINLSEFPHPPQFDRAAPDTGADSRQVLTDMGFDAEKITNWLTTGVISE